MANPENIPLVSVRVTEEDRILSRPWKRWFDNVVDSIGTKADLDTDAVEDNLAIFDENGNVVDSGVDLTEIIVLGNTAISADYTITDIDGVQHLQVTTGASDITVTMPTLADNPVRAIYVTKVDSGAGTVIIDGEGAETISGEITKTIVFQYTTAQIKAGTTEWLLI